MWPQRDLETSIRSLVDDMTDHIKLIKDSTGDPCNELTKLCGDARHHLMTLAKKMEVEINKTS